MLKGEGNEDGKRINRSYRQKKYTLHLQNIFLDIFLTLFRTTTT